MPIPCWAANWRARAGSLAATAVTTTSGTFPAGSISASGVIRAAPERAHPQTIHDRIPSSDGVTATRNGARR